MTRFGLVIVASMLAVDPFGWDMYGPLRWAALSTVGFAAIAISLGSGDSRERPLPRWSTLGWVILLVGMAASTALSQDRWHALIGTPDRHLGLATWILFAGLFATASLYPNTAASTVRRVTAIGAALSGMWAGLEVLGLGWFDSAIDGDRAGGPYGQPAFLGAAMVLATPLALSMALDRRSSRRWRYVGLAGAGLGFFALVLSQSQAAWVGVLCATACVVVMRRRWLMGALGALAIGALIVFTPLNARMPPIGDDDGAISRRVDDWSVGWRALSDTPTWGITGHGPEGYRIVFGAHVDEPYVIRHGRDVTTDRAHSGPLDVALTGGLIGLFGMVLLQVGLGVTALQRLRSDDTIDVALGASILGYLAHQFFLFPLAEVDPVLWIFAGLLVARRPLRTTYPLPLFRSVSAVKRVAMLGAGFFAAISAIAGLSDVAADHAVNGVLEAADDQAALTAADAARARRPDSIRYDFTAARAASRSGSLEGLLESLDRLDDGLSISPRDPALLTERAVLLLEIALRDGSDESLMAALHALEHQDGIDPNNPRTELSHGIALAIAGRTDEAIGELEHAATLDPSAFEPHLNLAILYLEAGDLDAGRLALAMVDERAPSNADAQRLRRQFLS